MNARDTYRLWLIGCLLEIGREAHRRGIGDAELRDSQAEARRARQLAEGRPA